jgi:murein DD-endopeptidase MepM/ murein hydrolase activator NlpD
MLSGSIDESTYPDRATSPFKLPFKGGESAWVIQGNNSSHNHEGREQHAWDFRRRCGTPVLAARGGTVGNVVDTNDGNGSNKPNNLIEVDHGDGTVGRYLHIQKGSARLRRGNPVRQGEELAKAGNVGNSLTGHIHFVVERGGRSIPVTFQDVTEDKGIPRTFESYTSGNR